MVLEFICEVDIHEAGACDLWQHAAGEPGVEAAAKVSNALTREIGVPAHGERAKPHTEPIYGRQRATLPVGVATRRVGSVHSIHESRWQ